MKLIRTFPGAADFELFTDCINQCYTLPGQRSLKKAEQIPLRHLEGCLVLLREGVPVARAAVYHNPELRYKEQTVICIGHYECIADETVSGLLLSHLETCARELNACWMIGPMNGSTWEQYRFINEASAPLFFTEPLHQPYYSRQWETCGWHTIAGYVSGSTDDLSFDTEMIAQLKERLEPLDVKIRSLRLETYREELVRLHPFLQKAFSRNFLYTPVILTDFLEKYLPLQPYLKKEFVLLAEDSTGAIVGVFLCIDDLCDTVHKTLIVKTVARDPAPHFRGLGHLMAATVYDKAACMGYNRFIHAFMYREGTSLGVSGRFNGQVFKTYRLLGKML